MIHRIRLIGNTRGPLGDGVIDDIELIDSDTRPRGSSCLVLLLLPLSFWPLFLLIPSMSLVCLRNPGEILLASVSGSLFDSQWAVGMKFGGMKRVDMQYESFNLLLFQGFIYFQDIGICVYSSVKVFLK